MVPENSRISVQHPTWVVLTSGFETGPGVTPPLWPQTSDSGHEPERLLVSDCILVCTEGFRLDFSGFSQLLNYRALVLVD